MSRSGPRAYDVDLGDRGEEMEVKLLLPKKVKNRKPDPPDVIPFPESQSQKKDGKRKKEKKVVLRIWPDQFTAEEYVVACNSEDPVYLVPPVRDVILPKNRAGCFGFSRFTWENNFCFLVVFLDILNACFIALSTSTHEVELCGLPMWDRCLLTLLDSSRHSRGMRQIAHHMRHVTRTYNVGDYCGFSFIFESLIKDFHGYGTIPPFTVDGKLPPNKPLPPYVIELSVSCTSCKRVFPYIATHTTSEMWSTPPTIDQIYDPLVSSTLMGPNGTFNGIGMVDVEGDNPVVDSYCNPRTGGCGDRGCLNVEVVHRPKILLISCEQHVKKDAGLNVAKTVSFYPITPDKNKYTLAGVVFHEKLGHFVGLVRDRRSFKYMTGYGHVIPMENVVQGKYKSDTSGEYVQFSCPLNYSPTLFAYTAN